MVARGWRVPEQNKTVGQPFILPFISEPRTRLISRNGSQGSRARLDSPGEGREGAGLGQFLRNPEQGQGGLREWPGGSTRCLDPAPPIYPRVSPRN